MSVIEKRKVAKIQTDYIQQHELTENTAAKRRKLLFRRLAVFFVFAAFLSFLMISKLLSQTSILDEKLTEKKKLEQQLAGLEKKQTLLEEEVVKLNDDDYIAKLARKEYFLSEKGEIIFNLPDKKKEKSSGGSPY